MPAFELDADEVMDEAIALGDELIEAGANDAATAKSLSRFLDNLLPMQVLVPGPAGVAAEAVDGFVFERIAAELIKAFRASPERRAKRKAKQASRKARRAAKKAARNG